MTILKDFKEKKNSLKVRIKNKNKKIKKKIKNQLFSIKSSHYEGNL